MGHAARMGKYVSAYRVLIARYGERRPLGRVMWRLEDNIKII
jgi:hypothetical protein